MSTEPIYLSTDKSEYSTPNSTPDHYLESKFPDSYEAINQLLGSQFEQTSIIGTATVPGAPTRIACLTSDDDDQHNLTPIIGNPAHNTMQNPQRRNHPIQLCQQLQPIPDTPESPHKINIDETFFVRLTYLNCRQPHLITASQVFSRGWRPTKLDITYPSGTLWKDYGIFGLWKIVGASHRRNRGRLSVYSAQLTRSMLYNLDWSKHIYLSKFWPETALLESGQKLVTKTFLTTSHRAGGCSWIKAEVRQYNVTATKQWTRWIKYCHYVIYNYTTTYHATPSNPKLTTGETPAKRLVGQKAVMVTNFWPLNIEIKPINCVRYDYNICVIFITSPHNESWEHINQDFSLMH